MVGEAHFDPSAWSAQLKRGMLDPRGGQVDAVLEAIVKQLDEFVPSDDDDGDTTRRLYDIFRGFRSMSGREVVVPAMFALFERFPEAEFGTPGPLVHEIEAIAGYEELLRGSLERQPCGHTVGMVNRILNTELADAERAEWLDELRAVLVHPSASTYTRDRARDHLVFQGESPPS